ncbi:hypothetical protein ABFB09_03440 [Dehalogenimonas sp. THU2]|uniref:hypothetical protein n=1 Tax=Dehalogenimonas sp. THU2 TaxID=3151121 RepID=UPI003218236A
MTVRYSGGTARLYAKDIEKPVADVRYQMMFTQGTKFTRMKWWGDFYASKELKNTGEFIMEFEDGSRGEVFVHTGGAPQSKSGRYQYSFNGRGRLSGLRGCGSHSGGRLRIKATPGCPMPLTLNERTTSEKV